MYCPNCKNQIKVNRFCTRCGLNLMVLRYQDLQGALTNRLSPSLAATDRVSEVPSLGTQRFAGAQTAQLAPRVTLPECATFANKAATLTPKAVNRVVPMILAIAVLLIVTGIIFSMRSSQPATVQAEAAPATQAANVLPVVETEAAVASIWTVVENQTKQVSDAQQALNTDEQMTSIEPGGQLALALTGDQFFGNGAGADIEIRGAAQADASYRVFVRNADDVIWQRIDINRRHFSQGVAQHDIGHHGIQQARQVMIVNDGTQPLELDSVMPIYPNPNLVAVEHDHHAH